MTKILITGSAGLIGSALAAKLADNGYDIIDCDIRFKNNPISFYSDEIIPILKKCDGIIHLGAIARVIHGEIYPELCNRVNVTGTVKFLEFYQNLPNKPWFIYGSSREVYGEQKILPVTEKAELRPMNYYAKGKVLIENYVNDLKKRDFNTLILRFSNVYGGMLDHYNRVVPAFCLRALKNEPIRIEGKDCVFDFTYLDDVVNGIISAVDRINNPINQKIDMPIHFTGNRGCNLRELAEIIVKITNSKSNIDYYPPRNFDVSRFYGDYGNAVNILNWRPKYSLETGLNKFITALKSAKKICPYDIEMKIYENIESYSWLPALL